MQQKLFILLRIVPVMNKQFFFAIAAVVILASCSGNFRQAREDGRAIDREIREKSTVSIPKVVSVSRPPVRLDRVKMKDTPAWLEYPVDIQVSQLPLMLALQQIQTILPDGISIWLDGDVDPSKKVSVSSSGTVADAINVLSRDTGYGIRATKTNLEVRRYETETFVLALPVGKFSAQLGTQGTAVSTGGELGAGASPRVEGQFMTVSYKDSDPYTEVKNSLQTLLRKDVTGDANQSDELEGSIDVAPSLGIITVRTTSARMANVRTAMARFDDEMSRQVLVEIRVLEFRSNVGQEQGIDWDLIRQTGEGTLKFFVPGTTTLSTGAGSALAWSGIGKWDGAQAFIRALKQQGQVSTETPVTALLLNNMPGRISQTMTVPYADEVKTQANENVVTAEVTRALSKEGVDIMITPKVQDDYVSLWISGKLSKIVNRRSEKFFDTKLDFLDTREGELAFNNRLPYGSTVVIGSIRQDSTTSEEARSVMSGGKGLRRERVETLVLMTPRRVH